MTYKLLMLTFLLFINHSAFASGKSNIVYQITEIHKNAQLPYSLIGQFISNEDLWNDKREILKLFKPVKGKNKVYLYMASFEAKCFYRKKMIIYHNIMALEVDKNDAVKDGLQYTLEWADAPLISDLYRMTAPGIKLKKGLNLARLKFKIIHSYVDRRPLKEKGVIDNMYKLEEYY